jgi:hypothetical protein
LLRCWEVEQRLRAKAEKCRQKYKPPVPGDVAVEIQQIPRLKEECEDFLYQAKNFLRDLLKLFNMLWGTEYEDASEWVKGKKKRSSVEEFIVQRFGDKHANATFIKQYKACIEPFALLRNAVEHPETSQLVVKNFARQGSSLIEPSWELQKDHKIEYGPLPIVDDMSIAVRNLLILAEDMLVMWARINLVASQHVEVRYLPEEQRNAQCPVKYRIRPTDALMAVTMQLEKARAASQQG